MIPTTNTASCAIAMHDRHQHDRHRAGRSRDLNVRSAEHTCHKAGDDRRDQAGFGPETGGDPERERQRQRDDTNGQPGDDVGLPRGTNAGVVGAPGQQPPQSRHRRLVGPPPGRPSRACSAVGVTSISARAR